MTQPPPERPPAGGRPAPVITPRPMKRPILLWALLVGAVIALIVIAFGLFAILFHGL